jgi:hypothetical protein
MSEYEKIIAELRAENLELRKNYFCLLEIANEEIKNLSSKLEEETSK